ncbi:MAG: ribosome maturation factor RimM [Actinomycetota bacterium]|nr:ribosome maturation factor RimM [Actinomycetota bacterium]
MLEIGRVVRPHGLKGQVVVELWTNREERVGAGVALTAGTRVLTVREASRQAPTTGHQRWLVTFEGVASREAADELRNTVLTAEPLDVADALWVHELIDAVLYLPDGTPVGTVEAVEANPASDLLVLDDGRVVPLTFVRRDEGRLTVDGPPGLLDP